MLGNYFELNLSHIRIIPSWIFGWDHPKITYYPKQKQKTKGRKNKQTKKNVYEYIVLILYPKFKNTILDIPILKYPWLVNIYRAINCSARYCFGSFQGVYTINQNSIKKMMAASLNFTAKYEMFFILTQKNASS